MCFFKLWGLVCGACFLFSLLGGMVCVCALNKYYLLIVLRYNTLTCILFFSFSFTLTFVIGAIPLLFPLKLADVQTLETKRVYGYGCLVCSTLF